MVGTDRLGRLGQDPEEFLLLCESEELSSAASADSRRGEREHTYHLVRIWQDWALGPGRVQPGQDRACLCDGKLLQGHVDAGKEAFPLLLSVPREELDERCHDGAGCALFDVELHDSRQVAEAPVKPQPCGRLLREHERRAELAVERRELGEQETCQILAASREAKRCRRMRTREVGSGKVPFVARCLHASKRKLRTSATTEAC